MKIDINAKGYSERTPLHVAISEKYVDAVKLLIGHEKFKPPHHRRQYSFGRSDEI
ncbi:MAG: hypothetical protein OXF02_03950 [Simkaniaceae bacterium]|nr:hypothetical protein [Simkaniaceae bacterium]